MKRLTVLLLMFAFSTQLQAKDRLAKSWRQTRHFSKSSRLKLDARKKLLSRSRKEGSREEHIEVFQAGRNGLRRLRSVSLYENGTFQGRELSMANQILVKLKDGYSKADLSQSLQSNNMAAHIEKQIGPNSLFLLSFDYESEDYQELLDQIES